MFYNFGVMGEHSRRMLVDRQLNQWSLFSKIIGQDACVDALADLCFKGLGNSDHRICENVVLAGPPSAGKTTIIKVVIQILNITGVFVDATQISKVEDIVDAILMAWAKTGHCLQPINEVEGVKIIKLPATVIFIDELHALPKKVQEGLLKATERADGMLFSKEYVIDCGDVFWIGATTHWGKLSNAFRTRFRRIDLVAPTFAQVVQMVKQEFRYDDVLSHRLVKYGGLIARETFSFVRSVQDCAARQNCAMFDAIDIVAAREQIDEFGMRKQRVDILLALRDAPNGCLLRSLVNATGCNQEELLNHWLVPLQVAPPGSEPMVSFDQRYFITRTGLAELKKRGL